MGIEVPCEDDLGKEVSMWWKYVIFGAFFLGLIVLFGGIVAHMYICAFINDDHEEEDESGEKKPEYIELPTTDFNRLE